MNDNVALSISQFSRAWRMMSQPAAELKLHAGHGFECIFTRLPIAFFNVVLLTGDNLSAAEIARIGTDAMEWARPTGVPWIFLLTHETLAPGLDANALLEASGFTPVMSLTGMLAMQVTPPVVPAGLELRVPSEIAGYSALLDVNSAAYALPMDAAKPLFSQPAFWVPHFPVLGFADGQPAATASVLMVDNIRYVALVATQPGMQRRGYADAAMRHALSLAADVHGELPSVLHASDAGRPVYARMGYEAISTHTMYMDKSLLGGH
jgi:GNAT superfamily N-acetyltransferase